MADKYWTGAGTNTNWNSSPTTNWANATYNGSNGNQTAPSAGDRVFFDANSGTGAAVWNVSISLTGLDCTGSRNQVTHNTGITMTITAGDVILPDGAGGSYTAAATNSTFTFTNTSGTVHLKTNGATITGFTRSGVGGTTQLTSDCNCSFNTTSTGISLTGGTIDLNSKTLTVPILSITGASARAITGAGAIVINNTLATPGAPLAFTGSNFTLPSFTATTTISGTHDGVLSYTFATLALTWGPLVIAANSGKGQKSLLGASALTFASITISGQNDIVWPAAATYTVTGAFNVSGSPTASTHMACAAVTTQTFSVGAASSINWAVMRGITFTGAGGITCRNSLDSGNNTGVVIAPPSGVAPNRCHL